MVKISIQCSGCGQELPKTQAWPDVSLDDPDAPWSMTVFVQPCPSCSKPAQPAPVYPRYIEADPQPVQVAGRWFVVLYDGYQVWMYNEIDSAWQHMRKPEAEGAALTEMRPDFLGMGERAELVQRRGYNWCNSWYWKITKREVS